MNEPAFSYEVVASVLQDDVETQTLHERFAAMLERSGGCRVEATPGRPNMYLVLTGGTEQQVLQRIAENGSRLGDRPVLLLAHRGNNSLPACLEILARIGSDGGAGEIVLLDETEACVGRVQWGARAAAVGPALRRSRIGAIGAPSEWLVASAHSAETLREAWGPELVSIPVEELRSAIGDTPEREQGGASVTDGTVACVEPGKRDLGAAEAVSDALRDLSAAFELDALTIRCFDLVVDDRVTACHAVSQLADEGLPAGCEGDIPSVLALLWLKLLLDRPGWMANPSWIDPQAGEVHLAHCTVPRSMVSNIGLRSHFESGLGVAIQGGLRCGPVTLFRIGGSRLEELWIAEGELVATPRKENLCRTQAVVRCDEAELRTLLQAPLGNHLVLTEGHHGELLRTSRRLVGPPA